MKVSHTTCGLRQIVSANELSEASDTASPGARSSSISASDADPPPLAEFEQDSRANTSFRIVSLRLADFEGTGDSRRAASIIAALRAGGAEVHADSLLSHGESLRSALANPRSLMALLLGVMHNGRQRPFQWLVVQSVRTRRKPTSVGRTIYVTSRVVPSPLPPDSVVDFVDSLAANARTRGSHGGLSRRFWLREARLLDVWERQVANQALVATAVTAEEAALIDPRVTEVPIERTVRDPTDIPLRRSRVHRPTVIFPGNLYYHPNHEAATWIIQFLVPELTKRGWREDQMVIAGHHPSKSLSTLASRAGVTLLRDVPDLGALIRSSNVAVAPMLLGSGVQGKVLDSLVSGTPVVITAKANRGLCLANSHMVRIVDRTPAMFANAIEDLTGLSASLPLPNDVRQLLASATPQAVQQRWRNLITPESSMVKISSQSESPLST